MPGAKGMMLAVLLTLMVGRLHDATPTRDGNYGQEAEEERDKKGNDIVQCADDESVGGQRWSRRIYG